MQTLSAELHRVVGELDDARALTWSADLSDTFGRSQAQLRRLIQELDAAARIEAAKLRDATVQIEATAEARPRDAGSTANWPYLAF